MKSNRFKTVAVTVAVAAFALLPGCSSMLSSSEPPPAIYVLHPDVTDAARAPLAPAVMEIPRPEVPAGFDVDKIALYWDQGRRLDYYAAAKWPTQLDKLLQSFISQSAAHALPGVTIVSPDLMIPSTYRLAVKALELQPVYANGPTGAPNLYVALHFTLVSLPSEDVIDDFTVAEHAPASSDNLTAVTGGLESLLQKVMGQAFVRLGSKIPSASAE